ncbi:MAG: class I SAM-dependent methyltransferase [Halioglobus sp.]|nr:class I SAM-dependent methyltransferase [Halioglobus sp.]
MYPVNYPQQAPLPNPLSSRRGRARVPRRTLLAALRRSLLAFMLLAPGLAAQDVYVEGRASRDGIGKFYMGREISHVMGHLGAGWLERSSREREERTDLLLAALDLQPGDVAADIGAGTGYFSLPMARSVGASGRVLAVDIQPQMLAIIERRAREEGVNNIETVLASVTDPKLPAGEVDLVLLVDAYHEFSHPREVMQAVVQSLSERGRVVLVEYRGEDPAVPIKPLHKMTVQQATLEMAAVGLALDTVLDELPLQHIMILRPGAR